MQAGGDCVISFCFIGIEIENKLFTYCAAQEADKLNETIRERRFVRQPFAVLLTFQTVVINNSRAVYETRFLFLSFFLY